MPFDRLNRARRSQGTGRFPRRGLRVVNCASMPQDARGSSPDLSNPTGCAIAIPRPNGRRPVSFEQLLTGDSLPVDGSLP